MGGILPQNPGSVTWMFKTLSGTVVDTLSDTERTNAKGKNANIYTTVGGVNMTQEGKTAEGTFLDIIRGVDWLQARITENVFGLFVTVPKVSYTNDGINTVVNRVQEILDRGASADFKILTNDPAPTSTAPLVSEISTNDKTNRILPDVTFDGVLAGAVHNVRVRGRVTI